VYFEESVAVVTCHWKVPLLFALFFKKVKIKENVYYAWDCIDV